MGLDLAGLLLAILNIFSLLLLGRALCSWFDPGFNSTIGRFLFEVTEPVVGPIRQLIPPVGMLDLSIIVTFFLLIILRQLIAAALA